MFLRSVKFRLTLLYALFLLLFLSLFSFWMYQEFAHVLYQDVDRTLNSEVTRIENSLQPELAHLLSEKESTAQALTPYRFTLSEEESKQLADRIRKWEKKHQLVSKSTLAIRILGINHKLLLSNLKTWERQVLYPNFERDSLFMEKGNSFQTLHFESKPIRLFYHLIRSRPEGRPALIVQVSAPLHELEKTLARLSFILWFSIPVVVIFAGFTGWMMAKRFFQPIENIIHEARQITAAYLTRRLPRTKSGDELDRLAETLNQMMDRLESSTRAIQDFSSDISHELKTPLAIIRGEIDLALRKARSPETHIETLKTIEGEVNELIRLVDDLMLLVRSDAGQLQFTMQPVCLADLLTKVAERFRERAQSKKIELSYTHSDDGWVQGDEIYLKRLFNNVIDNALKFTNEGGRVQIHLFREENRARVDIVDDGIGIDATIQAKVFSRFFRSDQARSFEGSGLGLNIAQAISNAHQAQLSLISQPGQGTRVTMIFQP